MTARDVQIAFQAGFVSYELEDYTDGGYDVRYERFADLIRAEEREAIAQMFEGAPALIPFAQNDKGGCMVCGFTPKLAMEAIRARGIT